MKYYFFMFIALLGFTIASVEVAAQKRVVFLPFKNTDGRFEYDKWETQIPDSMSRFMASKEPGQTTFVIVPNDSLYIILKELKADRKSPQWDSDVWKAAKKLKAEVIVSGNFQVQGQKVLLNAYAYDAITRMPNREYQAKDIVTETNRPFAVVTEMVNEIYPAIKGQ